MDKPIFAIFDAFHLQNGKFEPFPCKCLGLRILWVIIWAAGFSNWLLFVTYDIFLASEKCNLVSTTNVSISTGISEKDSSENFVSNESILFEWHQEDEISCFSTKKSSKRVYLVQFWIFSYSDFSFGPKISWDNLSYVLLFEQIFATTTLDNVTKTH